MPHHLSARQLANLDLRVAGARPDPQFAAAFFERVANYAEGLVEEYEACPYLVAGGSASRERAVQLIEDLPDSPSLDQLLDAKTTAQRKAG